MADSSDPKSINAPLSVADSELYNLIKQEKERQQRSIELIASENFTSRAVLECLGSTLTNKYSEGQINARYYGGTEIIDKIEGLCQRRCLKAFALNEEEWGVNVQPYSGSPANLAAYLSLLQPHDRIMGLDLTHGGHLTHGFYTPKKKVSATSIFFESYPYKTNAEGLIDFPELRQVALTYRPKLIIAGTSAYARHLDFAKFREVADECGAYLLADISHISGLVATGKHPSPFPYCDLVTSTTHKTLRGPRAGIIFFNKVRVDDAKSKVDGAVFPSLQGGPHNNVIAAVCTQMLQVTTPEYSAYCDRVLSNAQAIASCLTKRGEKYKLVTNGTDNHLLLWDLRPLGTSGGKMEKVCDFVNISLNKNCVPGDSSALSPSGVRIGAPGMTTRGMSVEDCEELVGLLCRAVELAVKVEAKHGKRLVDFVKGLNTMEQDSEVVELKREVNAFAQRFPIPGLPGDL